MTRLGSLPRGLSLGGGREGQQQQQLPAIEEETLEDLAEPELEGEESSAGLEAEVSAALGGAEERVEVGVAGCGWRLSPYCLCPTTRLPH
jgi:hypothetical protein